MATRRRRSCKYGRLKTPVRTRRGGTRNCKKRRTSRRVVLPLYLKENIRKVRKISKQIKVLEARERKLITSIENSKSSTSRKNRERSLRKVQRRLKVLEMRELKKAEQVDVKLKKFSDRSPIHAAVVQREINKTTVPTLEII